VVETEIKWTEASCATGDARLLHLFFSEDPKEIAEAKTICGTCPVRVSCLQGAVDRSEPWGVWGGHLFDRGRPIAFKRGRGRPRKDAPEVDVDLDIAFDVA
jgi:WhiB family transcriptional regulator, redox-sensing transcriptional regulator